MRIFFSIILVLVAVLYLVLETSYGLRLSVYTAQHFLPGKLAVEQIEGNLLHHIKLANLTYDDSTTHVALDKVDLDLQLQKNGLHWQGYAVAHQVNLNYQGIAFEDVQFNLVSSGRYSSKLEALNLVVDKLAGKVNGALLNGNVAFDYGKTLVIKKFQLNLDQANVNISGSMDQQWHLTYDLNIPQLAKIIPSIKGSIKSKGSVTGLTNAPIISLQSELTNLTADTYSIDRLNINANGKLMPEADIKIALKKGDLTVDGYKVREVQGDVRLRKHGENYTAVLTNAKFNVPAIKLVANSLSANAFYKTNDAITWNGTLKVGSGTAVLGGKTSLVPKDEYKSNFSLAGANLLVANKNKMNIVVSPDLKFQYGDGLFKTTGKIDIPSAKIVRVQNNEVVTLPSDVVYTTDNKEAAAESIMLANDIQINLGDNIEINYDNLKTKLFGSIHLLQAKGGQLTANGTLLTKDGIYNAFGKELKIKTGKIIYVGNYILNPGLDIEATRSIKRTGSSGTDFISSNKITVGVKVTGTLNQPHLSLTSQPMMSQTDTLSYLLFDTAASNLSVGNTLTLMNMAVSLNSSGKSSSALSNITKKMDKLGVVVGSTEVYDPVSGTSTTASTIGISKKLGRNITVSYQASPFNNLSVFDVHYKLSKYFVLRTQASNLETTADIIYEVEKKH